MTKRYLATALATDCTPERRPAKLIKKLLWFINANPAYDAKMHLVKRWLIEFEDGLSPGREVGLDGQGVPIMRGPGPGVYGFWLDTNMTYDDFHGDPISEEEFEQYWEATQDTA